MSAKLRVPTKALLLAILSLSPLGAGAFFDPTSILSPIKQLNEQSIEQSKYFNKVIENHEKEKNRLQTVLKDEQAKAKIIEEKRQLSLNTIEEYKRHRDEVNRVLKLSRNNKNITPTELQRIEREATVDLLYINQVIGKAENEIYGYEKEHMESVNKQKEINEQLSALDKNYLNQLRAPQEKKKLLNALRDEEAKAKIIEEKGQLSLNTIEEYKRHRDEVNRVLKLSRNNKNITPTELQYKELEATVDLFYINQVIGNAQKEIQGYEKEHMESVNKQKEIKTKIAEIDASIEKTLGTTSQATPQTKNMQTHKILPNQLAPVSSGSEESLQEEEKLQKPNEELTIDSNKHKEEFPPTKMCGKNLEELAKERDELLQKHRALQQHFNTLNAKPL